MLRKGHEVKWTVQEIFYCTQIKKAIFEAPVLDSPNYSKPFNIFYFASKTTLGVVLLQKNENGDDQPIFFFRKFMRDAELKYEMMKNKPMPCPSLESL